MPRPTKSRSKGLDPRVLLRLLELRRWYAAQGLRPDELGTVLGGVPAPKPMSPERWETTFGAAAQEEPGP